MATSMASSRAKQSGGTSSGKRSRKRHPVLRLICGICTLIALVSALVRIMPAQIQQLPYLPVIASATPWFIIVAAIAVLAGLVSRRWVNVLLSLLCIIANIWWQYPFFAQGTALDGRASAAVSAVQPDTTDRYARVMTFNVYKGHADARSIVEKVRDERVEVLALQETTPTFVEKLKQAGIDEYLPYSKVVSSDRHYGNGLWSATPLQEVATDEVHSIASFMPGATIMFDGGRKPVRFVSVHTISPSPGRWDRWSTSVNDLSTLRNRNDYTYVLMGDFNATMDHTVFRNMLGDRFQDAAYLSGHGFTFTWPLDRAWLPAFCDLDHIIVDQGMTAGQVEVDKLPGSDHAALLATIDVGA